MCTVRISAEALAWRRNLITTMGVPQWRTLIAWSAIYPLVLVLPMVVVPGLRRFGLPDNRFLIMLLVTATLILLMTHVIMPRYMRLVRRWLFK